MNRYPLHEKISSVSAVRLIKTVLLIMVLAAACGPAATAQPGEQPLITEPPSITEPPARQEPQLPVTTCDTLLPADACDPEWQSRVEYAPLSDLPRRECDQRFLEAGSGTCTVFIYTNNSQEFTITVEGAEPALVEEYIRSSAVYFEVRQAGTKPPPDTGLPSLATILVEAGADLTGKTPTDLSILRDRLTEDRESRGEFTTFSEVLYIAADNDSVPGQVLEVAVSRAAQIYAERGYDGALIPEEMQALMNEPGAPFLIDPAVLPGDDSAYKDILSQNPFGLAVILDWASAPKEPDENLWVVWYAIDPVLAPKYKGPAAQTSVNAFAYVYYKERCNVFSASSRISATSGSMTNTFWRANPYLFIGSRTADVRGVASPSALSHSSAPGTGKYDTYVRGGSGGGQYYIYGGWVQGSGCR